MGFLEPKLQLILPPNLPHARLLPTTYSGPETDDHTSFCAFSAACNNSAVRDCRFDSQTTSTGQIGITQNALGSARFLSVLGIANPSAAVLSIGTLLPAKWIGNPPAGAATFGAEKLSRQTGKNEHMLHPSENAP